LVAETLAVTVLSVASGVSVRRVTTSPDVKPHSAPLFTAVTSVSTTKVRLAGSNAGGGAVVLAVVVLVVEVVLAADACACCAANWAFTSSAIACLTSGVNVTAVEVVVVVEEESVLAESVVAAASAAGAGSPGGGGSCAAAYAACRFAAIR
jgi:hypothetical protein